MSANHESILFVVKRVPTPSHPKFATEKERLFLFRTQKAARVFVEKRNTNLVTRAKVGTKPEFRYLPPERATWGPDN